MWCLVVFYVVSVSINSKSGTSFREKKATRSESDPRWSDTKSFEFRCKDSQSGFEYNQPLSQQQYLSSMRELNGIRNLRCFRLYLHKLNGIEKMVLFMGIVSNAFVMKKNMCAHYFPTSTTTTTTKEAIKSWIASRSNIFGPVGYVSIAMQTQP